MSNHDLKICLFYCSNSSDGTRLTECCSKVGVGTLKTIGLPCSGKVNLPYLVKAFETGADAVLIVTCRQDECRSLEGNLRARRRADAVDSLLKEIGLGTGRIMVVPAADDVDEVCTKLEALCSWIGQDTGAVQIAKPSEPEGLRVSRSTS
jgi:coenzyme F420-reducing hydrogenase delta subunit